MPFMIETTDGDGVAEQRARLRPAHLARIEANLPLIIAAGARLTDDGTPIGSLYLLEVEDRAAAQRFIAEDPYSVGGVYRDTRITRWRKGFLNHARITPVASA